MRHRTYQLLTGLLLLSVALLQAQLKQPATTTLTGVPGLVRVSSSFHPSSGAAAGAMETVTLAIYAGEVGGTALWQETQNVAVDSDGHYSVLLGSTRNEGLPLELFASGEQRWLGVQFQRPGESEQPRVLLASVPYALKAADADTLGGRPASSYLLAEPTAATEDGASKTGVTTMRVAAPRVTLGTANTIAKFVNSTDLGNSVLFENTGRVGLGTVTPADFLHVTFSDTSGGTTGYAVQNTASGASSYSGMFFYDQNGLAGSFEGFNNSTHEFRINNTAPNGSINFMLAGNSKLKVRSDGDVDVSGNIRRNGTLFLNSSGTQNTGVGAGALAVNTGTNDTALGFGALTSNTGGSNNTASGINALANNLNGNKNTADGAWSLLVNTAGNNNTAVGYQAGEFISGSFNIMIGNQGNGSDDHVIRIGDAQVETFIAGIRGVTTAANNAVPVMIDANGQLGTVSSSRRFKEDIQDMGDTSSELMRLRPVTYRYRQPYADGSKPLDYGLIAEEVADIYPDLVVKGKDGQVETVQYQKLTPMLLNELQKLRNDFERQRLEAVSQSQQGLRQEATISRQYEQLARQEEQIRLQNEKNQSLEQRLAALELLLSNKVSTATAGQ